MGVQVSPPAPKVNKMNIFNSKIYNILKAKKSPFYLYAISFSESIFFPIPPQANNYLPKRMGDDDLVFPNYKTESYHNEALREWALKSNVKKHIVPQLFKL